MADLAAAARDALPGAPGPEVPDWLDAGFTHREGTGGAGFAAGGVLDRTPAGWLLAMAADRTWDSGLGQLSDPELVGLLSAAQRNGSRQAALGLAVIGELAARRAGPDGIPGEHLQDEIAAVLTLTGWTAARQVALAAAMTRLPDVAAALAAGWIDPDKARVFADELIVIDDDVAAAAIAASLVPRAPGMTTSELRRKLRQKIASFDPQAAKRRKEKAEKDARVESWVESDGTGAIAGRGMNLAKMIAADQQVDADARWLQANGAPGTLDQLRVEVFLTRLCGQPLYTLLPEPSTGTGAGKGTAGTRASAASASTGGAGTASAADAGALGGGLGGSVNLTMPAGTWLGVSDAPGEAGGYGTIDAGTCRDLAAALAAAGRRTRWCITLVDRNGWAVAHGCARAGPGPPGTDRAWLASVTITTIESGTCSHRRESATYRPSASLRHVVKVRSPRCGFPGCRHRSERCDDDHTVPHHKGGKTCECNLYPLCRRHHRAKQAQGWRLTQPEPGILTWTLPCGRQVTVTPEPYPV